MSFQNVSQRVIDGEEEEGKGWNIFSNDKDSIHECMGMHNVFI